MQPNIPYDQLFALKTIIEEGSFIAASRKLGLTQSAVSQRIQSLEQQIGAPLLVRSTPIQPTQQGRLLINHIEQVKNLEKLLRLRWAKQSKNNNSYTTLKIAVNSDSLNSWFLTAIESVLRKSKILIEFYLADQSKTADFLKNGDVFACITNKKQPPAGCQSFEIGSIAYALYCSKRFLNKHLKKKNLAAFYQAPLAQFDSSDQINYDFLRKKFKNYDPQFQSTFIIPNNESLVEFTREGICYCVLPVGSIAKKGLSDKLVRIFPQISITFPLYWHVQLYQTEAMSLITEEVRRAKIA